MPRKKLSEEEKLIQTKKKIYNKILAGQDITVTELGKLLGKKSTTIYKWEQNNIVKKPAMVNGKRIYDLKQLRELLHSLYDYKWERNTFDREELKKIMDYLDSVVDIEVTVRKIGSNPYEFKGDLY